MLLAVRKLSIAKAAARFFEHVPVICADTGTLDNWLKDQRIIPV